MRRRIPLILAACASACALATTALAGGTGGIGGGGGGTGGGGGDGKTHLFPVPSKHQYGDGWGAGRGHEGQDIFAPCGKPLIAARAGRIEYRDFHSAAGHYVVINGVRTDRDYMYGHLRGKALVRKGERVRLGQRLGYVGQSGNAQGCHLHFELWDGDWNGQPDVTRQLRRWDSWS